MSVLNSLRAGNFTIGVIHVPPFATSLKPNRWELDDIISYCVSCATSIEKSGFSSVMIQNVGDEPTHLKAPPEAIAYMSIVGKAVKNAVTIPLGVCMLDHDGKAPIALAKAVGADYVRIKTYVGTMTKMTGTLNGIYYDAVRYRRDIRADEVDIFADIFDKEGYPLGNTNLAEMSHFAEYCCLADGLIITGRSLAQTQEMLAVVKENVSIPILIGGGVNAGNIGQLQHLADGFVIGNCLKVDASDDFSDISYQNCEQLIGAMNVTHN